MQASTDSKGAVLKLTWRSLQYISAGAVVLLFMARFLHPLYYSSSAFIQIGLFSDRICSTGPFEMAVCPYLVPPYETLMTIFAVLLAVTVWIRK